MRTMHSPVLVHARMTLLASVIVLGGARGAEA